MKVLTALPPSKISPPSPMTHPRQQPGSIRLGATFDAVAIIMKGIYDGIFTPTQAVAVAVLLCAGGR
jgi:hypothetical protein